MVAAKFKVSRTGDKSQYCGNDWSYQGKVDITKFPADVKPIDFRELLKPQAAEKIQAILKYNGGTQHVSTVSRTSLETAPGGALMSEGTDESIPF